MIGLINLNLLKRNLGKGGVPSALPRQSHPRTSLLGIALDGHRLEAVSIRRSNGSVRVQGATAGSLQLNLLTDPPELVGREIRNSLDRARLRERYCTVCLPLEWALTIHTPLPDLPPEDVDDFLALEAERAFPFPPDTLSVAISRCRSSTGAGLATLIAIPKEHLTTLLKVLKAARLKPISFSLGLSAMQHPAQSADKGLAALRVGENSIELQVACGGGIAALRTLQGALEQDGARKKPYVDVVARDLRITLGQLSPEFRETVQRLNVFGNGEDLGRFVEDLRARAKGLGLEVQLVRDYSGEDLGFQVLPDVTASPALSLALRFLAGHSLLEFLPPKVSAWKQLTGRYSSQKLTSAGIVAGALLLLVIAAFLWQHWQLSQWQSRWSRIQPRVVELDAMQQRIRQFRPWFDESFSTLSILQKLTEAFPEDGAVTAKTVEIRDSGVVTCSGTLRDPQALLNVAERIRTNKEVSRVQVDQIRGKQFNLNLRWGDGGGQ